MVQQNHHMSKFKKDKAGKFISHAHLVDVICENCLKKFKIKNSSLKYGRGKCCSRKCVDENKKKTMVGENNGMYGKTTSMNQKIIASETLSKLHKSSEFKNHCKEKLRDYVEMHGYYPGQSPESIKRRAETVSKMSKEEKRKNREKTELECIKRYGKTPVQIRREALNKCKVTSIEKKISNILNKIGVKYTQKYTLPFENSYKEYDFFIDGKNILIEADGDFWHANPKFWLDKPLLDVQISNISNDELKNGLAKNLGYKLLRFWETDINGENFEEELVKKLKIYEVL